MEDKHFVSVLQLIESEDSSISECSATDDSNVSVVRNDARSVTVCKEEPHPHTAVSSLAFYFDFVFPPSHSPERDIYSHSIAPLVNSVLEGFHGTIISLGDSHTEHEKLLLSTPSGIVMRAAKQIFRCLKELNKSGLSANLVVPCSYVLLQNEVAHDLLCSFKNGDDQVHDGKDYDDRLQISDSKLVDLTTSEAKRSSDVIRMLQHGDKVKLMTTSSQSVYQTIFTIGVQFAKFGSMFAPISGTLSFVTINLPNGLDLRDLITANSSTTLALKSVSDFVQALHTLTLEVLPNVPNKTGYSTLMQILKESLGGNCKTLLISCVSNKVHSSHYEACIGILQLASKARNIENKPDKTKLAKEALMNAYMRELQKLYGETSDEESQQNPEGSNDNKDAELAAKALISAIRGSDKGESDSDNSEESDDESHSNKTGLPEHLLKYSPLPSPGRSASRRYTFTSKSQSSNSFDPSSEDLTMDALIVVIQDPDKGVPRACTGSLEHVKIHRGKGSVFSGYEIVKWLVKNIAGVMSEEDAERIGQIMLDKGAIFHSEGSSVFANSANLFYYARDPRPGTKPISAEEIQALLRDDKESTTPIKSSVQVIQVEKVSHPMSTETGLKVNSQVFIKEGTNLQTNETDDLTKSSSGPNVQEESSECSVPTYESVNNEKDVPRRPNTLPLSRSTSEQTDTPLLSNNGRSISALLYSKGNTEELDGLSVKSQGQSEEAKEEDDEEEEGNEVEATPNLKVIFEVPHLETLEKCSDYPHPLHYAAATNNEPGVITHLINWYGVDKRDERNRTPLMFSALGNKARSCNTLIEHGAVIDQRERNGLTSVHIACYNGHKETLTVLLKKGANIGIKDKMLHTAFHWSTVPSSADCLKILLRHSPKSAMETEKDKSGLTPIHWAIFYNHLEHLKLLLPRCTDLLILDSSGKTFANYAIERKSLQCLQCLLNIFPKLASYPDKNGLTPLHHSSASDTSDYLVAVINTLKKTHTLDLNVKDNYGRTAVHYATLYDHIEILKLLLHHGADPNPVDHEDKTPLLLAKEFGIKENEDIIKLLKEGPSHSEVSVLDHNGLENVVSKGRQESGVCYLL